jgi:DNA-binding response OmpR family regulator
MYKILIVEDDRTIRDVLERQLVKWGYLVQAVDDFQGVLGAFEGFKPHLVLLDITLPFFNGYHWCEQIRKISQTPILFLSSASDDMNLVMAINLGADDFIAKPFNLDVVTAKIQALLRRAYSFGGEAHILQYGDVALNVGEAKLLYGTTVLELTKNESKILQLLLEAKGSIVTRDTIIRKLWDDESFVDDNTLTVNVARLRKKLVDIGLSDLISTKKGLGYFVKE